MQSINPATGLHEGTFGVGTFSANGKAFPGLVQPDGRLIDLSAKFHDTHEIFDDWARNFDVLVDIAAKPDAAQHDFSAVKALKPLAHPNLLCAGANYKTHSAQMLTKNKFNQHNRKAGESDEDFFKRNMELMERRAREGTPFFWTGLHSSLVGANDDVVLPVLGTQPDWELELGAVVAKHQRYATIEEAQSLIAGYVIVNDIGTVDIFRRTDIPWGYDWISKHQPSFKVAGPFIVPSAFFKPDHSFQIQLQLNGKMMQDWPSNDMIFSPAKMLAYASERINLTPGDTLITGSPPGNGMHHGTFLKDGDTMESSITGLGRQKNRCVQEATPDHPLAYGYWKNEEEKPKTA
ncbi:fumarylacetoacetate hydrolase family protein [Hydrogenophaga crassostreae]|uniref:Fumarylacetoacetate hydrolase n=1 Tax=Hydrogenophaga crassostreae TaxID=1763535 RepID=A0A1D8NSI8_9BURK|nr:fumarylacetoacetate hydrolase family protein [Hydrogenophaga crassostreae]AOW12035.1 fumarylacetoacetate hydrolase [Hydrogenophaga crassostreae]